MQVRSRRTLAAIVGLVFAGGAMGIAVPLALADTEFSRRFSPARQVDDLLPEELPELDTPEYATDAEKATDLAFHGRYKLALYKAHDLGGVEGRVIRARCLLALGRYDRATAELTADEATQLDPAGGLLRAKVLRATGKHAEAVTLLRDLIKRHPTAHVARLELGEILEERGDLTAAIKEYAWFNQGETSYLDKWAAEGERGFEGRAGAELLATAAAAIDRWATLTGKFKEQPALHEKLLSMYVGAYDLVDRSYWPARLAAAEYLLHRGNGKEAEAELKAAFTANPNSVEVLEALGKVALESFNFDGAEKAIAGIRAVNRTSVEADLLEARNLLLQRRAKDAEPPLQRVLKQQPDHIEALGLLAASQSLQLKDDLATATLKQVEALDADNATAYLEVAEQLAALRQYPRSAAMYKVAIDRAPWWTAPRNGLGLLYTQSGDEDDARVVLRAAYELDPFNVRTVNYLRLLDQLAGFERRETEHFVIMYDKSVDPVIGDFFAAELEKIHADVAGLYRHKPAVKTYIEVFPTHAGFSVRTTGSPWIGTVGASTGRVIALVSPRQSRKTLGPFNWTQVLRHEYVHTVTLSLTENRIPHWMTEGLAVLDERTPMRWDWVPMLYDAVSKDGLFTMDGLTWGFVRPRKPNDRQLAYAQSGWICQYIEEKYGRDAILKMLAEFRAGGTQESVFPKVLNRSQSEFYDEFQAWARAKVNSWGYDDATTKKYDELVARGEQLIKARQYAEAVKVWEEIASIRPVDQLPHQRLAGLYLTKAINDPTKALQHLATLHAAELKDNRYGKRIARLLRDQGKVDEALKYVRDAIFIEPYDIDAHELAADLYAKKGDQAEADKQKQLVATLRTLAEKNKKDDDMPPAPPVQP
jgi:tetratricopeptide (TPR) repeat protein